MSTYQAIDRDTQTAERLVRALQGLCLLASFAYSKPLALGGRAITFQSASKALFSTRICILSLDLGKDVYRVAFAQGDQRAFKDLRDNKGILTHGNVLDLSGLIVDISTVSLLLTDTLGLIPPNRVSALLDTMCDPALVVLFSVLFKQANTKVETAKTSFDLIHTLAPYLLAKWADKITPVTLVVTGLYGAYAIWQ